MSAIGYESGIFKRIRLLLIVAALLPTVFSAGCGGIFKLKPPSTIYMISPAAEFRTDIAPLPCQLVIAGFMAGADLDTELIALRPNPFVIKYYADSTWRERATVMLKNITEEFFEKSGRINVASRQSMLVRADYILSAEVRDFQAEYPETGGAPQVKSKISFKLIHAKEGRIVSSRVFESAVRAEADSMLPIIRAFEASAGRTLNDAVSWTFQVLAAERR